MNYANQSAPFIPSPAKKTPFLFLSPSIVSLLFDILLPPIRTVLSFYQTDMVDTSSNVCRGPVET